MIKLSLTFTFLFVSLICVGQTTADSAENQLNKDTSQYKTNPLFVLKRQLKETFITPNLVIDVHDIDSIAVIKPPASVTLYGEKVKNGVIEISLKYRASLINYDDLMSRFNINQNILPVFIDSILAYHPNETYFELKAVKTVKIETEKNTGLKYISIISEYPISKPKKGEVHIIGKVDDVKVN